MPFSSPLALLGLLSAIPLIILYMIRPKPKDLPFPSTAFILEGEAKPTASLNRLITDPLFWVQLLVIVFLVLAAAGPYTEARGTQGEHLVVVIDLSASMEASFSEAEEIFLQYASGQDRISIVLAENIPIVALREGNGEQARTVLESLSPKAVSADLSAGMMMGKSLLGAEGGQILVVSDFISWTGDDPEVTRRLIESEGTEVAFVDPGGEGDNVGIVGGWIVDSGGVLNYSCLIRNYGRTRTVPIKIEGPGGASTSTRTIDSGGESYLTFDAFPGVNSVILEIDDAISFDNRAYVYTPELRPRRVLYLGDEGPVLAALRSISTVVISRSGEYGRFDLVVMENATTDGDLNRYVYGGGKVVYVASNDSASPEYLPVRITGVINESAPLWTRNPVFAEDLHFDEVEVFSCLQASARPGSVTIAEANGVPVISYWRLGSGTVVYLGLSSERSDFYQRPEYPIFWYEMTGWLTNVPDASESNRKTGEIVRLGETTLVDAPGERIATDVLLLDRVGIYRFQGQTLAANMYDPIESNLMNERTLNLGAFTGGKTTEKVIKKDISPWMVLIAAGLVVLELLILRRRRES
ncbi:MAG TPA: BatA domain-containing protein [Methanothrix sp.]|nr:BatA domain-containing protein [Methanothrix sp.]HPJ84905.1 BatA domain-containing protein [Methanothrix sp.]